MAITYTSGTKPKQAFGVAVMLAGFISVIYGLVQLPNQPDEKKEKKGLYFMIGGIIAIITGKYLSDYR